MKLKFRFLLSILGVLYLTHSFLKDLINDNKQNSDETNFRFIQIPIYNQDKDLVLIRLVNKFTVSNKNTELKKFSISDLFKILESNNVILIDINILRRLKTSADKLTELARVTFGFEPKDLNGLNKLDKELKSFVNRSRCNYFKKEGYYKEIQILTSLYVKCVELAIQISILYERGSFLWIGSDVRNGKYLSNISTQFGDASRAINRFKTTKIAIDSIEFNVPENIGQFLFDYQHSSFLECNEDLARKNLKPNYFQKKQKNQRLQKELNYISNSLEGLHKEYWLCAGTLLGWYRDCGIIPHTVDADLMVRANDFDVVIIEKFKGNKKMPLRNILGTKNDSLELRLTTSSFTYDLFFAYKSMTENQTGPPMQWSGYQVGKLKYRMMVPDFNVVCSAELLNHKYLVPCQPEKYLDTNYGPSRWKTPESDFKKYVWPSIKLSGKWTDDQLLNSVRFFSKDGEIDQTTTFNYLNKSKLDEPLPENYFFKDLKFY